MFSDAAEIIQSRGSDHGSGKHEYYVHYEGCKYERNNMYCTCNLYEVQAGFANFHVRNVTF